MSAWSRLKQLPYLTGSTSECGAAEATDEQEQITIARILANLCKDDPSLWRKPHSQSQQHRGSSYSPKYLSSPSSRFQNNHQQNQKQHSRALSLPHPTLSSNIVRFNGSSRYSKNIPHRQHRLNAFIENGKCATTSGPPSRPCKSIVEVSPPWEEHQRDEEEWLEGKSSSSRWNSINWATSSSRDAPYTSAYQFQSSRQNPSYIAPQHYSGTAFAIGAESFKPSLVAPPVRTRSSALKCSGSQMVQEVPRNFSIPRDHNHAPAVHVRTMIPVCSAPPRRSEDHRTRGPEPDPNPNPALGTNSNPNPALGTNPNPNPTLGSTCSSDCAMRSTSLVESSNDVDMEAAERMLNGLEI
eukprot:TRINITY_DN1196_c0_g1_i6.p1 TRINITY_DN1196_c0_g1~~TRINITY_DN1196_c0_g1_i6.p1  ORF type:complete len:354 (-),score=54.55 TRINITY_DN1196_c0_g1_i6:575-1636(-)